jgi:hypothetical protein
MATKGKTTEFGTAKNIAEKFGHNRQYVYKLLSTGKIEGSRKAVNEFGVEYWVAPMEKAQQYFDNAKTGFTNVEGFNKRICWYDAKFDQQVANFLHELCGGKVAKAPTHANPEMRYIEPQIEQKAQ